MPEYTVAKSTDGRGWWVLRDGVVTTQWHGVDAPYTYKRKKDAVEQVLKIQKMDEYMAGLRHQDKFGYVWTPEECVQIEEYGAALKVNAIGTGFWDRTPLQDRGRKAHFDDAKLIKSWYHPLGSKAPEEPSGHGEKVVMEVRRTRAARVLAFSLAGETLPTSSFEVTHIWTNEPTGKRHPFDYTFATRHEADMSKLELDMRGAVHGHTYDTTIVEIPDAWPIVRVFEKEAR